MTMRATMCLPLLVVEAWPEAAFHVLLWPYHDLDIQGIEAGLRRAAIPVHRVAEILEGFQDDPNRYLIPVDEHPNARACDGIARYVIDAIAGRGSP